MLTRSMILFKIILPEIGSDRTYKMPSASHNKDIAVSFEMYDSTGDDFIYQLSLANEVSEAEFFTLILTHQREEPSLFAQIPIATKKEGGRIVANLFLPILGIEPQSYSLRAIYKDKKTGSVVIYFLNLPDVK